jgi:hypothetical protein
LSLPDLTDEQRALLERVKGEFQAAEDGEHKRFRERADGFWAQYHAYTDFKRSHASASERDRDSLLGDAKNKWGARLYLPYAFTAVETIVPRMLSNRPRMLFLPGDKESAANTENMRWLMDRQQEACDYELSLQDTAKTGLIVAIGWRKTYWKRTSARNTYKVAPSLSGDGYVQTPCTEVDWDDPFSEDLDPYDVLWDPFAKSVATCQFIIHRTWRSTSYVLDKLTRTGPMGEPPEWSYIDGSGATAEDVQGGGKTRYDELWAGRKRAQGYGTSSSKRGCVHEVWEYHGGGEVITVLDRQWPVRKVPNPSWHGELPFACYRPVHVSGRMVGKSTCEMIEGLESEMNTMRNMRIDNAKLVLQKSFFFEDGAFDPVGFEMGPGMFHPVRSQGSLRDALVPIETGEIPNSSYREVQELHEAIERTTGVSDQTSGAGVSQETATGAQLVQAAANVRIQNATRRLELETCKAEARQWLLLNQQHIIVNRTVRIPQVPQPGQPDSVWAWRQVGPAELAGTWDIEPEGGATAPENVPQDRQDAELLSGTFDHDPNVDHRKLTALKLEKFGIKRPEAFMAPEQFVPPETLNGIAAWLEGAGLPPDQVQAGIREALDKARAQDPSPPEQSLQLPVQPASKSGKAA